jgi:tetratricopeptide (TPR) repeat protein
MSRSAVGIQSPVSTLPPGPMRDLVKELHELHRAAGMLSTRVVSDAVKDRDDLPDTVSHETVGMMLRGTRLVGWTKFECVVRLLAERSVNPVFEPLACVRRFHDLWLRAKDAAALGPSTMLRPLPEPATADLLHPLIRAPRPGTAPTTVAVDVGYAPIHARLSTGPLTNLGERNPTFVGREHIHLELDRFFRAEPRVPVVLSGPGGVGKSQLAIEYAYRSLDRYDLIWFVSAEDGFGAREMLAELGSRLRIRPRHHRERTVLSVLQTLEQTNLRWLLIFDNASPEIPLDAPTAGRTGDMIITTRAPEWPSRPVRLIPIDVLSRRESVRYLCAADAEMSEVDADGLAEMLGDLPLALAQLAATRKATGMPLARYLGLFERHVQELLLTGRAPYYPASLGATVKMSVEQLDTRSAPLLLIELFAHLGPDPVPTAMLRNGRHSAVTDVLKRCLDDATQLRASLDAIARLGLIRIDIDGQHAVAHRLVRLALRENLSSESLARGRANTHALLAAADPGAPETPANWPDHAMLIPHILPSGLVSSVHSDSRRTVLHQIRYLYEIGDYERSKAIAEAAISSWGQARELGAEHESTLLAMRHLANALRPLGHFAEARRLNERVVTSFENNPAYGPDHPLTLEAHRSRGTDLHIAGDYRQALEAERQNYERHRAIHGVDHPSTLNVANNRGNSHRVLGQYGEAESWHRLVVERRTVVLGPSHRLTYFARLNLAWDQLCLGRYQEAFTEFDELRSLEDSNLRPGHVLVLFIGRAHAIALRRLGRYQEAVRAIEANYAQCNESLGGDNEATLASGITYANSLVAVGRAAEAATIASETRQSLSRSFGRDNPSTFATALNVAIIMRAQGRWPAAARIARDARDELSHRLGPGHPYTISAANSVATDLYLDYNYGAARRISEEIIDHAARASWHSERHPDWLILRANAGLDRSATGDAEHGEPMRESAIEDLAELLSPGHPVVARLVARERVDLDVEPPPL